jgi:hypothetical protein
MIKLRGITKAEHVARMEMHTKFLFGSMKGINHTEDGVGTTKNNKN